ncbi:MAG: hypothetical protein ACI9EF_002267 [Pseudohongiellaceae bacterium]|jgi:hypothetical protein
MPTASEASQIGLLIGLLLGLLIGQADTSDGAFPNPVQLSDVRTGLF